jgi:hypothetical protein
MLLSEAFKIAFHISDSSTEDLKVAQATIEFNSEAETASFALVKKLALEAFSAEIEERRLRLRQQISAARRLHRKQLENTKDFTNKREPIPDYARIMTVEEWVGGLESTAFTPDDGSGYWATEKIMDRNCDAFDKKPDWATHVAWFNK